MKRTIYSRYLDWNLDTVVRIANPEEIEAGHARRFFVRATAKLWEDAERTLYSAHTEQVFITEQFADERLAQQYHDAAALALRQMIDQLRTKP